MWFCSFAYKDLGLENCTVFVTKSRCDVGQLIYAFEICFLYIPKLSSSNNKGIRSASGAKSGCHAGVKGPP